MAKRIGKAVIRTAGLLVMVLALSLVLAGCGPKSAARQAYKIEQTMKKLKANGLDDKGEAKYEKLEAKYEKLEEKVEKMSEEDQGIFRGEYIRLRLSK